jgi:hypothetical protein
VGKVVIVHTRNYTVNKKAWRCQAKNKSRAGHPIEVKISSREDLQSGQSVMMMLSEKFPNHTIMKKAYHK